MMRGGSVYTHGGRGGRKGATGRGTTPPVGTGAPVDLSMSSFITPLTDPAAEAGKDSEEGAHVAPGSAATVPTLVEAIAHPKKRRARGRAHATRPASADNSFRASSFDFDEVEQPAVTAGPSAAPTAQVNTASTPTSAAASPVVADSAHIDASSPADDAGQPVITVGPAPEPSDGMATATTPSTPTSAAASPDGTSGAHDDASSPANVAGQPVVTVGPAPEPGAAPAVQTNTDSVAPATTPSTPTSAAASPDGTSGAHDDASSPANVAGQPVVTVGPAPEPSAAPAVQANPSTLPPIAPSASPASKPAPATGNLPAAPTNVDPASSRRKAHRPAPQPGKQTPVVTTGKEGTDVTPPASTSATVQLRLQTTSDTKAGDAPPKSPGAPAQVKTPDIIPQGAPRIEPTPLPRAPEPGDLQTNKGRVSTEGRSPKDGIDITLPLQNAIATFYTDLEQCKNKRCIQAIKDIAARHFDALTNPNNTLEQKLQELADFTSEYEAIKMKDHASHKSVVNYIAATVAIVLSATLAASLAFLGSLWTGPGAIIMAVAAAFVAVGLTMAALDGSDRVAESMGRRRLGLFKPADESIAKIHGALVGNHNDDISPSTMAAQL